MPFSAAAQRNAEPILDVLRGVLPAQARVLEIAAGTGQHAAHFAAAKPQWCWQPSDAEMAALPTIAQRCADLPQVAAPVWLDVLAPWPAGLGCFDAVYSANMLHISPWATCAALMRGAADHLVPRGTLVVYGPFWVRGQVPAPGNVAFDEELRQRNPAWGLRELADVVAAAQAVGLAFEQQVAMPANNLVLIFRRNASSGSTFERTGL